MTYTISNDDAYDNVMEAMDFIDSVEVPYPADARALFHKLRATLEWMEVQVDGDWDSGERTHKEVEDERY
jgi:hypothetical protein